MAPPERNESSPPVKAVPSLPTPAEDVPPEEVLAPRPLNWLVVPVRSLRHRNYRLYFIGQLISLIGTWMQSTALTWLAFNLTQQSTWPALIDAAQMLPTLLFGIWGGLLADRFPKRSLIMTTQALFGVLALVLAILVLAGSVQPWQLLVIALANGLVTAVDLPARLAFVMDMVGRDDLMNAVALNSLLFNGARVAGPVVAGVLLGPFGAGGCFLINAISYLAVLWALSEMSATGAPHPEKEGKHRPSLLSGFAYLVQHPRLGHLVVLATLTAFCAWPFRTLLPALSEKIFAAGSDGFSWMLSGTGVGALVAAASVAAFGTMARRRKLITLGILTITGALLALSFVEELWLAVACSALGGFGLILFFATGQSVLQLSTAEHNRGQIMGIWAMTMNGGVPLGGLLFGPLADRWSVPWAIRIEGLGCAGAALYLFVVLWYLRRADRLKAAVPGESAASPT